MEKIKSIWIYSAFIFLLSLSVVLSWDDFFWGSSEGINQLAQHFQGYNGRYLGNMLIIAITRSTVLRIVVYTSVNVGIIKILSLILSEKVKIRYIALILMSLPIGILKQTYGWISGFANYNVSVLFVLIIFYLVFIAEYKKINVVLVLLIGFISQFLVENVSMVNVIISGMACVFMLFTDRKRLKLTIPWLASSVVGLWIMFQNVAYHSESSRGLTNVYFSELFKHLLQDWSELVVKDNIFLLLVFSVVMYFILNKPQIIGSYLFFFNIYFIVREFLGISFYQEPLYMLLGELVLVFIFFGIIIYTGIVALSGKEREYYFIFLFSAVLFVAPFLIVTPFGARNILLTYLMLAISLGILWRNLSIKSNFEMIIDRNVKLIIICLSMIMISLYSVNGFENQRRISKIKTAEIKGEKVVEIRKLPFPFLGQLLDEIRPGNRTDEYKDYYNISSDIEIKVINRSMPLPWMQTNN